MIKLYLGWFIIAKAYTKISNPCVFENFQAEVGAFRTKVVEVIIGDSDSIKSCKTEKKQRLISANMMKINIISWLEIIFLLTCELINFPSVIKHYSTIWKSYTVASHFVHLEKFIQNSSGSSFSFSLCQSSSFVAIMVYCFFPEFLCFGKLIFPLFFQLKDKFSKWPT